MADALLVRTTVDDPLDVLSVRYSCETGTAGEPVIVATMKDVMLRVVRKRVMARGARQSNANSNGATNAAAATAE